MKKQRVIILALMSLILECTTKPKLKDIKAEFPYDVVRKGQYVYVFKTYSSNGNGFMETYKNGEKIRQVDFPNNFNGMKSCIVNNNIYSVNYKYFSVFKGKKYLKTEWKDFDYVLTDIAPWHGDSLLVLEHYGNHLFHVLDLEGNHIRSFGIFPEKIPPEPEVFPQHFWVTGDKIYVTGLNTCNIYKYVKSTVTDTILWPDIGYSNCLVREHRGKMDVISKPKGINGIAVYKNVLYVTSYKFKLTGPVNKRKAIFTLQAYDLHKKKWIYTERSSEKLVLFYADNDGLYLLSGGYNNSYIKHWRGINDKHVTKQKR